MASDLDRLEDEIMAEMRKVYSEMVLDHAMNPRNVGSLEDADGFASVAGPCGDHMEIWVRVRDNRVVHATFWTDGCGSSIACGSMATELAKGQPVGAALSISAAEMVRHLGGLPDEDVHCAGLASTTLKKALLDYMELKDEPWKRAYRRR